jgi:hypothetical protein
MFTVIAYIWFIILPLFCNKMGDVCVNVTLRRVRVTTVAVVKQ